MTAADLFGGLALKSLGADTMDIIRDFNNNNQVVVNTDSIETKVLQVYVSKEFIATSIDSFAL